MNLFKYIYYKAHQLNLKNNNFGEGEFGSLLTGTFNITISFMLISFGISGYVRIIFGVKLFYIRCIADKLEYAAFVIIFVVCPVWFYLKKNGKKIIEECDRKSLTSRFYSLSPYLVIVSWYIIVTAWLISAIYLTP